MRQLGVFLVICALGVTTVACGSDSGGDLADGCEATDYPEATSEQASTIYVSVQCSPVGNQDGTLKRPYASIGQAVLAASAGDAILVQAGEYEEPASVRVDKPLSILGQGRLNEGGGYADASYIKSDAENAVHVMGTVGVNIAGLSFVEPSGAGILVSDCSEVLIAHNHFTQARRVPKVDKPKENHRGYGVSIEKSSVVELRSNLVESGSGAGIYLRDVTAAVVAQNIVRKNVEGIRVAESFLDEENDEDGTPFAVEILDNDVEDNFDTGIKILSSATFLDLNRVNGTKPVTFSPSGPADGVAVLTQDVCGDPADPEVCEPSRVAMGWEDDGELPQQVISGCERVGILVDGQSVIKIIVRNLVESNGIAGIWAQSESVIGIIVRNTIQFNGYFGIGLTSKASAQIGRAEDKLSNRIVVGTKGDFEGRSEEDKLDLGDAIAVFNDASAAIMNNDMTDAYGRVGVLLQSSDPSKTLVEKNSFSSVLYPIAALEMPAAFPDEKVVGNTDGSGVPVLAETQFPDDFQRDGSNLSVSSPD